MNERNFMEILNALGEKLREQETTISVQNYQIEELKKALREAEEHFAPAPTKQ